MANRRAIAGSLLVHVVIVLGVASLRPDELGWDHEPVRREVVVVLVDPPAPEPEVRAQPVVPPGRVEPELAAASDPRGTDSPPTGRGRAVPARGPSAPSLIVEPRRSSSREPSPDPGAVTPEQAPAPEVPELPPGDGTQPSEPRSPSGLSMRPQTITRAPGGPAVEARQLAGEVSRGGAFDPPPEKYKPDRSQLSDSGNGTKRHERQTFKLAVARDGTPRVKDKPSVQHLYGPVFLFDVTDWAMRQAGIDPYAYEKRKLLDETREERAAMSAAARGERIIEAERRLPALLARVWADERVHPVLRRRLLFELWDECAEDGRPDVVAAGERARAIIVAFVRARLGPGKAGAYSAAELERLNGVRTSRARFDPY